MELIFIRHAEAQSGASYAEDSLRTLTTRGRQVQEQVAKELQRRGFSPDVVLSSPRLRAEQTAWITTQVISGDVPLIEVMELDGGFAVEDLLARLEAYLDCSCVTCVGHEPDMTFWTNSLLANDEKQVSGFSNSMVVSLQFERKPAIGKGVCNYIYTADALLLE